MNLEVEKLGLKQCEISLKVLGSHHMVKCQNSKCLSRIEFALSYVITKIQVKKSTP